VTGHLSLCSGIGGLDLAVGTPDAFAENDPAPSEVLARHFPNTPNLGDWTQLESFDTFDLITAGLPCQPVSGAGKGKGAQDARYLFDDFVRILRSGDMRPTLLLENVRGVLYPRHAAGLWRFVSALADLGYVGRWEIVRASDAGAPHRRERWFCHARHPDSMVGETPVSVGGRLPERQLGEWQRIGAGSGVSTPDPDGGAQPQRDVGQNEPGLEASRRNDTRRCGVETLQRSKYGPAVRRWEALTRPCPAPLDDKNRLAVPFVEWMMGYPQGWVDGLTRTKALKALGNAVVPQQATLALEVLA
jgi:DNA (cytosine-5)-methyltransferase 1